jgi:hypothetical protein
LNSLTIAGIAGVRIVRSKDEKKTDRQSGIMTTAMAGPDSFWSTSEDVDWIVVVPLELALLVPKPDSL